MNLPARHIELPSVTIWRRLGFAALAATVVIAAALADGTVSGAAAQPAAPKSAPGSASGSDPESEDGPPSVTGLPLPRYVSLKSSEVNVRVGPSTQHAVAWTYKRRGMPLEVLAEFDNWRYVRDFEGDTGWVHHSLIDGTRTALVLEDTDQPLVALYEDPDERSTLVAYAQPMAVVQLDVCDRDWCEVEAQRLSGWIHRRYLWGLYDSEEIR